MGRTAVVRHKPEPELVRYDSMCRAIAECLAVDEVKDLRDKAMALEVYAHQATNFEAERQAQEIRVRAEKRCGQLLKEQVPHQGGRPVKEKPSNETRVSERLADLGVSYDQSSKWQQLADVPDETFEAVMADRSEPINTQRVLNVHRMNVEAQHPPPPAEPVKKVDPEAIHLWGVLREIVKSLDEIDIPKAIAAMPDYLHEGAIESVKRLTILLDTIGELL